MSTEQQNRPESRPSADSIREGTSLFKSLRNNSQSIRQALAVSGVGAMVLVVLEFVRLLHVHIKTLILELYQNLY